MSENDETTNMTPLSSSPSGPTGTRALSVSIGEEGEENETPPQPREEGVTTASLNADNENTRLGHPGDDSSGEGASSEAAPQGPEETEPEYGSTVSGTGSSDSAEESAADYVEDAAGSMAAGEEPEPAIETRYEDKTTEELRETVIKAMTGKEAGQNDAFALFERASRDFSAMMKTAREDAAVFGFKLMEFAQANAQSNFELARAYSQARSIPEIFNVQAEYMKRQLEILNAQAKELQALTTEIASKSKAESQGRRDF